MRSARSYRKIPLTKEEAVEEIKKNSGKQFDPKVVEAFLRVVDKVDF
jgi:HD-GYP domain-containing protein (c-di-GMP phosphodiesterase class II)